MLRYKLESIIYILVQIYFLKLSKDSRNLVLGNITHQSKIFFFVTVYLRLINVCPVLFHVTDQSVLCQVKIYCPRNKFET